MEKYMHPFDQYINNLSSKLPEMCHTKDLIRIGMYRSSQAAAAARKRGKCPEYVKLNDRVIEYPKQCVIHYLKKCHDDGKNTLKIV